MFQVFCRCYDPDIESCQNLIYHTLSTSLAQVNSITQISDGEQVAAAVPQHFLGIFSIHVFEK
jgi:hypothetical protein